MSYKHSRNEHEEYIGMQTFTKDNFYLFPVINYDRSPDDGHIISVTTDAFNGKLDDAINYTQGKALGYGNKQMNLIGFLFMMILFGLSCAMMGGFMSIISVIVALVCMWLIFRFFQIEYEAKRMQKAFRSMRSLDKNGDAIKIATMEEIQGFNCPMDLSDHLHTLKPGMWDDVKLGRYYAPQDMFSMVALITMSSPYTHNKAVELVWDMVFATKEQKIKIAHELCDLAMQRAEDEG